MKFSISPLGLGLAALLALSASPTLLAQQPSSETLQQRLPAPSIEAPYPSIPSDASSNSDLGQIGVVQSYPKPEMFTVSTSQQFFYTENVFYTSEHIGTIGSLPYLGRY